MYNTCIMTIQETIKEGIKDAMRAKDAVRLTTLRDISSKLTNEMVAKGGTPQSPCDDETALTVLKRLSKQRKDSIDQFTKGGRADLAANEEAELAIIETFLPKMMSQDEIRPIAEAKLKELGVTDKASAGKAMGAIIKELAGKADGADVKVVVESLLS